VTVNLECNTDLGSPQDEDRPPGFNDRIPASCSLLYIFYFTDGPVHGGSEIIVDVFELLYEADLVSVPAIASSRGIHNTSSTYAREKGGQFFVIHGAIDRAL
jgi:hypothetical protein